MLPPIPHDVVPEGLSTNHESRPAELYSHVVESPLSHFHPDVFEFDGPVSPIQNGLDVARFAHAVPVVVPNTAVASTLLEIVARAPPRATQLDAAADFDNSVATHL